MERLTERLDGWVMRKGCHGPCRTCDGAGCDDIYPMIDRLAAYEDTGLEPGEIETLQKRGQGLAEMLVNVSCGCAVSYSRLAELAQAEKDGRLVVLPCKEGTDVFVIEVDDEFEAFYACPKITEMPFTVELLQFVGTAVFFTRAEAEAALERRKEEQHDD